VGVGVAVAVGVAVGEGVAVGCGVGVSVGIAVGERVRVGSNVGVGAVVVSGIVHAVHRDSPMINKNIRCTIFIKDASSGIQQYAIKCNIACRNRNLYTGRDTILLY